MLTPLNGQSKRRRFGTFDIETRDWISPYALGFYDGLEYMQWTGNDCILKFLKYVLARKRFRHQYIYAHNGGRFDFQFLLNECLASDIHFDPSNRSGSRQIKLKVFADEGDKHFVNFVDSFSLLPYSLDKLTKDFNVIIKKQNFMDDDSQANDYEYLYQLYRKKDPRFTKYLRSDCIGLWLVVKRLYEIIKEKEGSIGLTLPATALKTFRQSCMNKSIYGCSKELNTDMKQGYFGGRTEIFKMYIPDNGSSYHYYDVNSLYPYVMKHNEYPTSSPVITNTPKKNCYMEDLGITTADVVAPDDLYLPVLPVKYDFKLFFPIGKFSGTWDNHQLRKAKELGYRITPRKSYSFGGEMIFKDYVDKFYSMKQHSEPGTASYTIAKLLMNSLYGKFGQHEEVKSLIKLRPTDPFPKNVVEAFDVDRNMWFVMQESKSKHHIPHIAIHVTALAQLRLYEYMEMALEKGGMVAYCDTDSIFTDVTLPTSDKLGDMKLETDLLCGYFILPKTYGYVNMEGKFLVRAKGFTFEFREEMTELSFQEALMGDFSRFAFESESPEFNTMMTSYRRHGTFLSTDIKRKSIQSYYDKRKILADLDTHPFKMSEIAG